MRRASLTTSLSDGRILVAVVQDGRPGVALVWEGDNAPLAQGRL